MARLKNNYVKGIFDSISDEHRLLIMGMCTMYGFKYTKKFAADCVYDAFFNNEKLETVVLKKIRIKKIDELGEPS